MKAGNIQSYMCDLLSIYLYPLSIYLRPLLLLEHRSLSGANKENKVQPSLTTSATPYGVEAGQFLTGLKSQLRSTQCNAYCNAYFLNPTWPVPVAHSGLTSQ